MLITYSGTPVKNFENYSIWKDHGGAREYQVENPCSEPRQLKLGFQSASVFNTFHGTLLYKVIHNNWWYDLFCWVSFETFTFFLHCKPIPVDSLHSTISPTLWNLSHPDMLQCQELKRASCYSNPLTLPIYRKSPSCKLHPYFKKCRSQCIGQLRRPFSAPPQESPWVVHFLEALLSVSLYTKWRSDNERINQQKPTVGQTLFLLLSLL